MRRLLLACTIAALPLAAHAELFSLGTNYNVVTHGTTGGDANASIPLVSGTTVLLTSTVELVTEIIPTSGGGEWLLFNFETIEGQPISLGGNFDLHEINFPAAVPVNFDGAFAAVGIHGMQQTWTTAPVGFTNYAPGIDPLLGTGLVAGPFTADFPAGPLGDFFTFINPFNQLAGCCGINTGVTTSYEQAWHFDPQQAPPSVPEPSTIALLGLGLLGTLAVRRRQRHN